jgi:hypothetical protein
MINKSFVVIMFGLLLIITLSVLLHFKMSSPVIYILLAIGFIIVGAGILLGFIKMVSDDKD